MTRIEPVIQLTIDEARNIARLLSFIRCDMDCDPRTHYEDCLRYQADMQIEALAERLSKQSQ